MGAGVGVECRVMPTQLRLTQLDATENLTSLEGVAVPYDSPVMLGWYEETMTAGMFAKSIREAAMALPLLLFHDSQTFPIGAASEWDDGSKRLRGVWKLDDSIEAQRAAKQARDGLLSGLSVGFVPLRSEWTYNEDYDPALGQFDQVRRLEARLVEVSVVPAPAFKDAVVTKVRSAARPPAGRDTDTPKLARWREIAASLRS